MKRQALTLVVVLGLLLVAGSAFGQTIRVKADIPFDFAMSGKTLPAGEYTIKSDAKAGFLLVTNTNSGRTAMVLVQGVDGGTPSDRSKLVFYRYGKSYFLRKISMAGYNGLELPATRGETEVAMDYTNHEEVVLASVR